MASTTPPPTAAGRVLHSFHERCCDRPCETADQFASNAVLEWFGRTIRGQSRIHRFFRYDVHAQYEQSFGRAVEVAAFETKATHLQTRTAPSENDDRSAQSAPIAQRDADASPHRDLSTPIDRIRCGPPATPGAPAQGRTFRRTPPSVTIQPELPAADEDDSDDMSGVDELLLQSTPPRGRTTTHPSPARICQKRQMRKQPAVRLGDEQSVDDCADILDAAPPASSVQYSELRYLEAHGSVRQHHSNRKQAADDACADVEAASGRISSTSPLPYATDACGHWERDVRLRISWRTRLEPSTADAETAVQFALIVYEHRTRNPRTRRNLMSDFGSTADPESQHLPAEHTPPNRNADGQPKQPNGTKEREPVTDAPKASARSASGLKRTAVTAAKRNPSDRGVSRRGSSSSVPFRTSLKRLRF